MKTTIWHVTPESNMKSVEENGIQPGPLTIKPFVGNWEDGMGRLDEGVYVCSSRGSMETYAKTCLGDVRQQMTDDENFALYKATVDRGRIHDDPEWEVSPGSHPKASICEGTIENPELVEVGL